MRAVIFFDQALLTRAKIDERLRIVIEAFAGTALKIQSG